MKLNLIGLLFGIAFGGVLAASNLHEYDTIHAMLRLDEFDVFWFCLLYTSPSPRDRQKSRMPSSA